MSPAASTPKATSTDMPSMTTRRSNSNADQEPPAKRPRLKLNLRKPSSNDGDTIAVSRPKRASATRSRYSEDAVMLDDEVEEIKVKPSPSPSSGLSSPVSVTASVRSGVLSVKGLETRHEAEARDSSEEVVAVKTKEETRHQARESYGDFMSYYVADGDEEEAEEQTVPDPKPKRQPSKSKLAATEKQPRQPRKKQTSTPRPLSASPVSSKPSPVQQSFKTAKRNIRQYPPPQQVRTPSSKPVHKHAPPQAPPLAFAQINQQAPHVQHATYPPETRQPPNGMHHQNGAQPHRTTQPPKPTPYTLLAEVITVKYHAPIDVKVKKLQALSASLMNFGGVPPGRNSPAPENGKKSENVKTSGSAKAIQDEKKEIKSNGDKGAPVDDFLAMFDDESGDDGESEPKRDDSKNKDSKDFGTKSIDAGDREPHTQVEQKRYLEHTGVPDGPLTYGIQFIMDALHSWAEQRIRQQRQQHLTMLQARMLPPALHSGNNVAPHNLPATLNGQTVPNVPNLNETPEGQAIAAFRDVVESGCLQVNLILPADLAKAVSHLYLQIDHLINQGNRVQPEPPYQPMSYSSQIIAHQKRLDRFKDDQARRQQESAQQGLYSMYGMAPPAMLNGFSQHAPFQHPMYPPSGRRRSTPTVPGQPHAQIPSRVSLPAGASGPINENPAGNPSAVPGAPRTNGPQRLSREERERMMYAPNLRLPRSGQMMNFSFAHENPAAIQAFGQGSFPTKQGPSSTVPSQPSSPPVAMSSSAPPSGIERPSSKHGKDNVKLERESHRANDTDAHAHPPKPTRGFTAVNVPAKPVHDTRTAASTPKSKTTGDSHSDAVILDDD